MALLGTAAQAAEWGTITGRIVYDGKAPGPTPIIPDKDTEVCGKHKLFNESLEVGPNGGLKDAAHLPAHRKSAGGPRI